MVAVLVLVPAQAPAAVITVSKRLYRTSSQQQLLYNKSYYRQKNNNSTGTNEKLNSIHTSTSTYSSIISFSSLFQSRRRKILCLYQSLFDYSNTTKSTTTTMSTMSTISSSNNNNDKVTTTITTTTTSSASIGDQDNKVIDMKSQNQIEIHVNDSIETTTLCQTVVQSDVDNISSELDKVTNILQQTTLHDDKIEKLIIGTSKAPTISLPDSTESISATTKPTTITTTSFLSKDELELIPKEIKTFCNWIQTKEITNIILLCGAGISVNAGIPDFRTPGTGLYDNLQKYNLPYGEAIFDIDYYKINPYPFCTIAQTLWPGQINGPLPTLTHIFISLLYKKHLLYRCYTQNIDGLEYLSNIPDTKIIECHGHFRTATCISCHKPISDMNYVYTSIVTNGTVPLCPYCNTATSSKDNDTTNNKKKNKFQSKRRVPGYIKPDIVFFGENLPEKFHTTLEKDIKCTRNSTTTNTSSTSSSTSIVDCVLVLGTSLQVAPVSQIPDMIRYRYNSEYTTNNKNSNNNNNNNNNNNKKRPKGILFNKEYVGNFKGSNDLYYLDDCDTIVIQICKVLGWYDELIYDHQTITNNLRQQSNSTTVTTVTEPKPNPTTNSIDDSTGTTTTTTSTTSKT